MKYDDLTEAQKQLLFENRHLPRTPPSTLARWFADGRIGEGDFERGIDVELLREALSGPAPEPRAPVILRRPTAAERFRRWVGL